MKPAASIDLQAIARHILESRGFLTDVPSQAQAEVEQLQEPRFEALQIQDLSRLLWSSIDNDDSRDLDQIEYAERLEKGYRLFIGIANVDAFVGQGSAIDQAAQHNTTSLYTGIRIFPMLPLRLSTDLSSLLEGARRLALVIDMQLSQDGELMGSSVYAALVQNQAQLTYTAVAQWLANQEGSTPSPTLSPITQQMLDKITRNQALQKQLQLQAEISQRLCLRRHEKGALTFETIELRPRLSDQGDIVLESHAANPATQLIEDFMIVANQASVAFLESRGFPSFRRVVRTPKRWNRIVELATAHGSHLPEEPNSRLLENFLKDQQQKDPDHFPDVSLAVIKLLGRGEYVVKSPGTEAPGHFSLAVEDYAHSTAPNRRYPDLITQRLLLAAAADRSSPYAVSDLAALAQHCTLKEDDANKAERAVRKCMAAVALSPRIGEEFEGFITGVSEQGVWVRLLRPPIEGRIQDPVPHVDVGDKVRVKLVYTNPQRGYIDFQFMSRN